MIPPAIGSARFFFFAETIGIYGVGDADEEEEDD
jgi:hypothetical protein